jgi:glycerol-3-phosphate acyltransferase PlsY
VTGRLLIAVLVGYAAGTIPFGLLLTSLARRTDLRQHGSGNIGATNALRVGGKAVGIATLLLDMGKSAVGIVLASEIAPYAWQTGWSALLIAAPVVGHCYPVWLRFRGGKGVASAFGALLLVDWRAALAGAAVFLVLALPTRLVSLGSLGAAVAAAAAAFLLHGLTGASVGVALVALVIIVRHRENIARLLAGTESRVDDPARPRPGAAGDGHPERPPADG